MKVNEAITEMRKRGYEDNEISKILQEQGISPREINDALSQSKIKQAVSEGEGNEEQTTAVSESEDNEGMMPSLSDSEEISQEETQEEAPEAMPDNNQPQAVPQAPINEQYPSYPQENYGNPVPTPYAGDYGYNDMNQGYEEGYSGAINTDTISEIVEQNISEKITKVMNVLTALSESKVLLSTKQDKMEERLSRIESIIDELQMTLIRKAGQQEENIEDIKTEMEDMREGFQKVVNPLVDNLKKESTKKPTKKYKREQIKKKK